MSPVPSTVIRIPVFSNRRNLQPARLSTVSTAIATNLKSKTCRLDAVSALLSHRSRLTTFSIHKSSCFLTSTLMNAPRPAPMRCGASVHHPWHSHPSELHSLLIHVLTCPLSVRASSKFSSDCSAGTLPRPFIRLLRKHFSAHAMQNSLLAHAFSWKKVSVRGGIVHCRFSTPRKGCAMETLLLPLGGNVSDWSFLRKVGALCHS